MDAKEKKEATLETLAESIDNLAIMTAKGFESVDKRFDKVEGRMDKLETEMQGIKTEMQGLRSSVNNYLELSDKRYLELKAREKVIINWVKIIADKTGVQINLEDLEKVA